MPVLTVSKTYVDGNVLSHSDLDAALDSISTFLNTTKIDSANIQAAGIVSSNMANNSVVSSAITDANVTTQKLADAAVTTAKITDANVTTAKIADANVTTAKIADANVTTAKMADANVTSAKIASNVNLAGNAVQENGKNLVVSSTNASTSLAVIRGACDGATGGLTSGEGFTGSVAGGPLYHVVFSNAFADVPTVLVTPIAAAPISFSIQGIGTTGFFVAFWNAAGTQINVNYNFTATGAR